MNLLQQSYQNYINTTYHYNGMNQTICQHEWNVITEMEDVKGRMVKINECVKCGAVCGEI